ncbi:hypothetical protein HOF65_06565 [bacterium]|nr:hypothetical protein [bacterium]MBT4632887.1 hypothetical protein [bacterium]
MFFNISDTFDFIPSHIDTAFGKKVIHQGVGLFSYNSHLFAISKYHSE